MGEEISATRLQGRNDKLATTIMVSPCYLLRCKIVAKVLLNRLNDHLEQGLLPESQSSVVSGKIVGLPYLFGYNPSSL